MTPSVSAMPSSSDMPAAMPVAPGFQNAPDETRLPLGSVSAHDRLNSLSANRRARTSANLVVSTTASFTSTSRPRTIGRNDTSAPTPCASCARASSTCSGRTLMRNWLGASGGRLARQSRIRSPRTIVSSSSDMRPNASAPICRLDANARRRRLARPKRHVTPRCGRRFNSASNAHAANAAASRSPATPPTMMRPDCTSPACHAISNAMVDAPSAYASMPPARGRGRSRRSTRNGGTRDSAINGGKAKPPSSSNPAENAATPGAHVGGGKSLVTTELSNITRTCWPASASATPTALAAMPRTANCTKKSDSVCRTLAPKQRNIAAASRCRRR